MPDNTFVNYAKYYDQLNIKKPYKQEIEFIYDWAGKPKSILDLGCGTASYWKYYPKDVMIRGIDSSEEMIKQSPYKDRIVNDSIYFPGNVPVDCATALFDVVNYTPNLNWFEGLPIKKDGCLIFDTWDLDKVDRDGFRITEHVNGKVKRTIVPYRKNNEVDLVIVIEAPDFRVSEVHTMFLYSHDDIVKACGKEYIINEVKETETWQKWYRLKRL
jgi:SAM-dependent methyltransferase